MKNANMPTVDAFLESTTVRLGGKLGFTKLGPVLSRERLGFIDAELYNWWLIPINANDRKIASTLRLMGWCSDWAKKHQGSDGASRTGAQRMIAVQNLVTQCKLWLGRLNTDGGKLQTLGDDYKAERNAYKNAKMMGQKINPVGGSYMHAVKEKALPDEFTNTRIEQIFAKPMDRMTPKDFKDIADAMLPQSERHKATTLYMDGGDRDQHMLTVRNGGLCDADGNPITEALVYAMSKYGTIYAFDWKAAYFYNDNDNPTGFFNHSSFMSGKDVICAGTIEKMRTFKLAQNPQWADRWMITTESGHYRPSADHLKNCLKSLKASGLDLTKYLANTVFPPPGHLEPAETFIR